MEFIIINNGLQEGIIGATLFAILVLMAVVTVVATPLFELVYGRHNRATGARDALGGDPVKGIVAQIISARRRASLAPPFGRG